jgi:hypothetical protein
LYLNLPLIEQQDRPKIKAAEKALSKVRKGATTSKAKVGGGNLLEGKMVDEAIALVLGQQKQKQIAAPKRKAIEAPKRLAIKAPPSKRVAVEAPTRLMIEAPPRGPKGKQPIAPTQPPSPKARKLPKTGAKGTEIVRPGLKKKVKSAKRRLETAERKVAKIDDNLGKNITPKRRKELIEQKRKAQQTIKKMKDELKEYPSDLSD